MKHKKYNIKTPYTNDGTDINNITPVLITWSCHLFFFNAAKIPSPIPIGIAINDDYTLIKIVGGKNSPNILATGL